MVCYPAKFNWNTLLWRISVISYDKNVATLDIFSFTSIFIAVARTTVTSEVLSIFLEFSFRLFYCWKNEIEVETEEFHVIETMPCSFSTRVLFQSDYQMFPLQL